MRDVQLSKDMPSAGSPRKPLPPALCPRFLSGTRARLKASMLSSASMTSHVNVQSPSW